MDTLQAKEKLIVLLDTLPDEVQSKFLDVKADVLLQVADIGNRNDLVLYEMERIYEGILKILKGEETPSNLLSFITGDPKIEEDNRPKIPELAYEIQTKIFDPVLPILKEAGMQVKEGRVAKPITNSQLPISNEEQGVASPYAPVPSPLSNSSFSKARPTEQPFGQGGVEGGGFKIPPPPGVLPLGKGETPLRAEDGGAPLVRGESAQLPLDEKNVRALLRIASGTTYSEQELREAFADLPQGLRQSISSVDTANAVQEIAKKYLLHVDQMGALASETGLVLLGLTHPAEFIGNLARRLRLPEEKAKEIAREVSAEILVKVREALRGLHEDVKTRPAVSVEPARMNIRSDGRLAVSKEAEKKPFVTPNTSTSISSPSSSELNTERHPPAPGLNASASTPYSAGAKWNMGENILAKQAGQKEASLNRAEVLRDIENPKGILNVERHPPTSGLSASPVGPTGWKPATADGGKPQSTSTKFQTNTNAQIPNIPNTPVVPKPPVAPAPSSSFPPPPKPPVSVAPVMKARPESESSTPSASTPQKQDSGASFLDQKLQAPMASPREEKRYTSDPYREPLQ